MATRSIGIIINGATGGICNRQHLDHALIPIIREGGLSIDGEGLVPNLLLVGRDDGRLEAVARRHGLEKWTTDLDAALANPDYSIFFDAGVTGQRGRLLRAALNAGKDIYTEKPAVTDLAEGHSLIELASRVGRRHGVVEDKLFLPGLTKLRLAQETGFFGRVTGFRLDFGYWIFSGHDQPMQRPSWNYQASQGGGLMFDMYPHWRYIVEGILGPISRVVSRGWTAIPERVDEQGRPFPVDVDDSNATLVELESGGVGVITSSWATRVNRNDLLTFQIDGTGGSAVAGLHRCRIQPAAATPKVRFDPNVDLNVDYRSQWMEMPETQPFANGYRKGWEAFLRAVVTGGTPAATLEDGLRDVALAQAVARSASEDRWVAMNDVLRRNAAAA
jgi:predicted dehydrogenase